MVGFWLWSTPPASMRLPTPHPPALLLAGVLLLAACASGSTAASTPPPESVIATQARGDGAVVIPNDGDGLEGHTPRGFAGSGTGLFVGDNLNPNFPEGDGVQTFLTFALDDLAVLPERAVVDVRLTSIEPTLTGSPFGDLGPLVVHEIIYEEFGPTLFDLQAVTPEPLCTLTASAPLDCDVSQAVTDAVASDAGRVQFRLSFERAGDGDGQADLASFFLTDSNTNEPGIFNLVVVTSQAPPDR
jgi:hypothetical protein